MLFLKQNTRISLGCQYYQFYSPEDMREEREFHRGVEDRADEL